MLKRLLRVVAFLRHVPLSRVFRRLELSVRCRLGDHFSNRNGGPSTPPERAAKELKPLFAPRAQLSPQVDGDGLTFRFLNRAVTTPLQCIDWNAPSLAPCDQLWRMNLHYMEYIEAVDDALWTVLVAQWLNANGSQKLGARRDSWNCYSLSLRVVVWLQELERRSDSLAKELRRRVEAQAAHQLRFLESNLETDIGGNHLIKNIKALLWASAYFSGPEAEHWRALGLKLLAREIAVQILPDGVHYERSPSYHAQVFADLLECRHALGRDPLGGRLDAALHKMAQVSADLSHPDGAAAQFNDAGATMAYSPGECLDVYARLYGERPKPRRVFALPHGGYYGARGEGRYFVADCGRIAPDDLPAHGHGDVLSFEWSVAGERIIVDQGVYEYNAGPRRQLARAARSHNTLSFAGVDQADFFGAFRCGRRPHVVVRRYEPRGDGFLLEGAHDGYAHLSGRPWHLRRFEATPGAIRVVDRLEGRADRAAQIGFLLHPEVEVSVAGAKASLTRGATRIAMTATGPITVEEAVWWPDMGVERSTRRLIVALPNGDFVSEVVLRVV